MFARIRRRETSTGAVIRPERGSTFDQPPGRTVGSSTDRGSDDDRQLSCEYGRDGRASLRRKPSAKRLTESWHTSLAGRAIPPLGQELHFALWLSL